MFFLRQEEEEVPEFVAEDEIEESDLSDIEVSNLELDEPCPSPVSLCSVSICGSNGRFHYFYSLYSSASTAVPRPMYKAWVGAWSCPHSCLLSLTISFILLSLTQGGSRE